MVYTKFVADYFTCQILVGLRIFNDVVNSSINMTTEFKTFIWNISIINVRSASSVAFAIPIFISKLVINYANSNFTTLSSNLYDPGTSSFSVKYKFHPIAVVSAVRISCVVFDVDFDNNINYTLDSSTFYLQDQFAKINFYADAPYSTHFMGFHTI